MAWQPQFLYLTRISVKNERQSENSSHKLPLRVMTKRFTLREMLKDIFQMKEKLSQIKIETSERMENRESYTQLNVN